LGYQAGEPTEELGPATKTALEMFQADQELPTTGEPDDATKAKLKEVYGS
jgi:peptidoglycan hydrolase-like protein with peptidoglycan-binding domain